MKKKLIALLDAWLEEDKEEIEDSSSFQEIMESLDEHRLSNRKLFKQITNNREKAN